MSDLFGLVLAGGYSTRMGTDKSLLRHHGQHMLGFTEKLLQPFCSSVFFSCREDQRLPVPSEYLIFDVVESVGPIVGIYSAMKKYPGQSWLVLAVDLPKLDVSFVAKNLMQNRDTAYDATILKLKGQAFLQPLMSIYEESSWIYFEKAVREQRYSMQQLLLRMCINTVSIMSDVAQLSNFNTPEDWENIKH